MLGLALIASGAFAAISASSALATTRNWVGCKPLEKEITQRYHDSNCTQNDNEGQYVWGALTKPTLFTMANSGSFNLKLPRFGVNVLASCSSLGLGGTVENHAIGNGTFSQSESDQRLALSGCAISYPSTSCTFGEPLTFAKLKGEATEVEGKPATKFSPAEGSILITFTLSNCGLFNGTAADTGYLVGVANKAKSSLEFLAKNSAIEKIGSLEGTAKIGGFSTNSPLTVE